MTFRVSVFNFDNRKPGGWLKDKTHSYQTQKAFDQWRKYHKDWALDMSQSYGRRARVLAEAYKDGHGWVVVEDWSI